MYRATGFMVLVFEKGLICLHKVLWVSFGVGMGVSCVCKDRDE